MIFPTLFHPASALSAPSLHFPLEGKALSVVILFPHMRVFALTLWGKWYSRIVAIPIGEGGPRQRRSGTFVNCLLETISPALFHPASALSAPMGHLPLEGKAGDMRETCHPQTFRHRPIYICGEAATTTLNPEPQNLVKQNPLTKPFSSCIITSVVVMNYVY